MTTPGQPTTSSALTGPAQALLDAVSAIASDLDLTSVLTRIVTAWEKSYDDAPIWHDTSASHLDDHRDCASAGAAWRNAATPYASAGWR